MKLVLLISILTMSFSAFSKEDAVKIDCQFYSRRSSETLSTVLSLADLSDKKCMEYKNGFELCISYEHFALYRIHISNPKDFAAKSIVITQPYKTRTVVEWQHDVDSKLRCFAEKYSLSEMNDTDRSIIKEDRSPTEKKKKSGASEQ